MFKVLAMYAGRADKDDEIQFFWGLGPQTCGD